MLQHRYRVSRLSTANSPKDSPQNNAKDKVNAVRPVALR